MRLSLIAALLAASALVPSAASAQDRAEWRNGRPVNGDAGQRQQAPARPAPAPNQSSRSQPPQSQVPQYRGPANPPPVQPRQQDARSGGGWRNGGPAAIEPPTRQDRTDWRGNAPANGGDRDHGDRGGWNGVDRNSTAWRQDARNGRNDGQRGDWHNADHGGHDRDWRDANHAGDWSQGGNWNRNGDRNRNSDWNRHGDWNHGGAWNRDWRHDRNYDWNRYRDQNRYAYHLPRYYAPGGWGYGYRRFGIGITLNSFLFGQDYWIDDPYEYRLPPVDGPYRWVRYYNDALLVDIRSGYVVDTVYDIFW